MVEDQSLLLSAWFEQNDAAPVYHNPSNDSSTKALIRDRTGWPCTWICHRPGPFRSSATGPIQTANVPQALKDFNFSDARTLARPASIHISGFLEVFGLSAFNENFTGAKNAVRNPEKAKASRVAFDTTHEE